MLIMSTVSQISVLRGTKSPENGKLVGSTADVLFIHAVGVIISTTFCLVMIRIYRSFSTLYSLQRQ